MKDFTKDFIIASIAAIIIGILVSHYLVRVVL